MLHSVCVFCYVVDNVCIMIKKEETDEAHGNTSVDSNGYEWVFIC